MSQTDSAQNPETPATTKAQKKSEARDPESVIRELTASLSPAIWEEITSGRVSAVLLTVMVNENNIETVPFIQTGDPNTSEEAQARVNNRARSNVLHLAIALGREHEKYKKIVTGYLNDIPTSDNE